MEVRSAGRLGQRVSEEKARARPSNRACEDRNEIDTKGQALANSLEDLLLWKDPLKSAKVLGTGCLPLLCHYVGNNLVRSFIAYTFLALSSTCCLVLVYFPGPQLLKKQRSVMMAVCCLLSKHLFGRKSTRSKIVLGLFLWLAFIVGRSGLISQATLGIYLWGSLFTLPCLYKTCQPVLDGFVEECFWLGIYAVNREARAVIAVTFMAAFVATWYLQARIIILVSVAGFASFALLLWHLKYIRENPSEAFAEGIAKAIVSPFAIPLLLDAKTKSAWRVR